MIEARIQCTCVEYTLEDLSLKLRGGEVVWLPEAKARASVSLAHARRAGAVSVQWLERCQVSRAPTPPWLVSRRGRREPPRANPNRYVEDPAPVAPPAPVVVVAPSAPVATPAPALPELEAFLAELQSTVQSTVQQELRTHVEGLEARYKGADGTAPRTADRPTEMPSDVEPVFIPSSIVRKDVEPKIDVKSESGTASNVDDAAAALKNARAGKPRKAKAKETPDAE